MNLLIRDKKLLSNIPIDYTYPIFCDTETCIDEGKSSGGLYGQIRLVQVYQKGWEGAFIIDCFFVDLQDVLKLLKPGWLVWHNASYDMHCINLYTKELWLPSQLDDTLYLSRLTYSTHTKFGFYECIKYAGLSTPEILAINKKEQQKFDWSGALDKTNLNYAEFDVTYLCSLYAEVEKSRKTIAYQLDIFNLKYAIEYSRRGIPTNPVTIKKKLLECVTKLEKLLTELPLNPNSPKQCKEALGTQKADRDTLVKAHLEGSKLAGDIREARLLSKTRMYLMKYSRPRIYGFYNPCGAISGRFSCSGGHRYDHSNTQQIPRRLLDCLEAPEGHVFVYKDYAGLELRMAVAYTGETTMESLMRAGVDLHTYSGTIIYGVTEEEITSYQRMIGKIMNFTLVYGAQVPTVQAMIRGWGEILMPFNEVKNIRDRWLAKYEYFPTWHRMHARHIKVYGYLDVETALGRKVRTYTVPDSLNIPIQGSSAEVTKMSLKYLKERYPTENLINTIHDSNCLLVEESKADLWIDRLNECMVDAWYYVIKNLAIPDLPMPAEAESSKVWDF